MSYVFTQRKMILSVWKISLFLRVSLWFRMFLIFTRTGRWKSTSISDNTIIKMFWTAAGLFFTIRWPCWTGREGCWPWAVIIRISVWTTNGRIFWNTIMLLLIRPRPIDGAISVWRMKRLTYTAGSVRHSMTVFLFRWFLTKRCLDELVFCKETGNWIMAISSFWSCWPPAWNDLFPSSEMRICRTMRIVLPCFWKINWPFRKNYPTSWHFLNGNGRANFSCFFWNHRMPLRNWKFVW